MGAINRRKVNISIAITPRLLKRTENAVKEGEYSSVSDAVQTILSEFIGKEEILRNHRKSGRAAIPGKTGPDQTGILSETLYAKTSSTVGKARITVSLNARTAGIVRQTAEEAGENVSNFISGILEKHFKSTGKNDRVAEEKAPYDTGPGIIRIPEKEADRFALSYVEKMFREQK